MVSEDARGRDGNIPDSRICCRASRVSYSSLALRIPTHTPSSHPLSFVKYLVSPASFWKVTLPPTSISTASTFPRSRISVYALLLSESSVRGIRWTVWSVKRILAKVGFV